MSDMSRPNKRCRPVLQFDSSSDDDSDVETSSIESDESDVEKSSIESDESDVEKSSIESDESDDEEIVERVHSTKSVWKLGTPEFVPRKSIPEYKEPETSIDEHHTITEVFFKLFPKSMFMWIAQRTNERLAILNIGKVKKIPSTDWHEIMVVIGCLLVMSYNRVPHMHMYWSGNKSVKNETIANAISRERFAQLHSKLYFNTPTQPDDARKTYYMTPVIDCLKKTFNKFRSEAVYQSIDETMVKCKARTTMKQRMPQKPEKNGIKNWTRADAVTGYVYDFNVYEGAEKETLPGTLGERVVNTLCETIRENDVAIVCDRFFTSVHLMQTLPFACVGTVQGRRKNLPDLTGKLLKGQSKTMCHDDGVVCFKWQDSKEVILLSNCHGTEIGTTERKQKDGSKKTFDCPDAIIFYNRFMGGVDKADQYSTYYQVDRKSKKWWKRMFNRLLLVTISNCWILHKQFKEKKMSLIDFLIPLSEDLIEIGRIGTNYQKKLGAGRPSKRRKLMGNVGHQPIRGETKRRCAFCTEKKKQSRSYYTCSTCEIPLCVDCFAPYHK